MRPVLLVFLLSGCASQESARPPETGVQAGLTWLASHQSPDGHWGAASFRDRCVGTKCSGPGEASYDAGVTGLAILAFLGAANSGDFDERIRKAVDWLVGRQDSEGCLGGREAKHMYSHAIATIALCEAIAKKQWTHLTGAAQKAVDFLVAAQNPGKGWRYSSRAGENDSSVTAWCVLALRSAELAGLRFPKAAYVDALAWYTEMTDHRDGTTGYVVRGDRFRGIPGANSEFDDHPTSTAAACLSRYIILRVRSDPAFAGLNRLMKDLPNGKPLATDFYYWFFGSAALRNFEGAQGVRWNTWSKALRETLEPMQVKEGCARGSWHPESEKWFCCGTGRVYTTSLAVITLELLDSSPGILMLKGGIYR